jgi:hypothetical protein
LGAPAIEDYFGWLCRHTGDGRASYWALLHQLHTKPFECVIPSDANRGEDGKELRETYEDTFQILGEDLWLDGKASMLEVLIGLSKRLEFDTDIPTDRWFWKLLENLGMQHYTDVHYTKMVEEDVDERLDLLLRRRYSPDGVGGLFPLREAVHDQRRVEIWYQMQAYLLEGDHVDNGPR